MIKKLKLSAVNTQPTPTIHCIQYDTDRQVELCFDDIELAGLQEARIYGKKPDGTEFYNDCTIEDGKLIAPLTSQALAVKGIVPCQIQLVFGGTLTTYTFNVVVDDSLVSESAIESSNEYTALENALAEVEEIIGEIGDGIVKSVNGLKNDVYFVDGENTYVMTNIPDNEISYNITIDDTLSDASLQPVQNKVIKSALDGKESTSNKVTEFTGDETDTEYPSAKLVYDTATDITTQMTNALDGKLDLAGGTITGDIVLSGGARVRAAGTANPAIVLGSKRIGLVGAPQVATDAANKQYVDDAIAAALIVDTEEVIP